MLTEKTMFGPNTHNLPNQMILPSPSLHISEASSAAGLQEAALAVVRDTWKFGWGGLGVLLVAR